MPGGTPLPMPGNPVLHDGTAQRSVRPSADRLVPWAERLGAALLLNDRFPTMNLIRPLTGWGRDDEFVHGRTGHSTRSLAAHRQIAVDRRILGAQLTLVLTGGQSRVTEPAALRPRNTDRSQCGTGTRLTESRGRHECSESSSGSRVVAQSAEPARGSMCAAGGSLVRSRLPMGCQHVPTAGEVSCRRH